MKIFDFDFYEIIVWVMTLILCLIAAACRRAPLRRPGGLGQPLPNPIAVILPIIFYTVFVALRKTIGDTYFYMHSFNLMPDYNPVEIEYFFTGMFGFFQNIIRNMTDDPQWLIAFAAVFSIPVPLIILYKYCPRFEMAIFMFVAFSYLGGAMNGMRQYMAASIVILGTRYLFSERKTDFIKYAVLVLLAYCMHNSAIIMLPIYFVVRRKAWKATSYLMVVGSMVAVVIFDAILPQFLSALEQTSYSNYSENGWFTSGTEGGSSLIRVMFIAYPLIVAYLNRERLKMLGRVGDILANIVFVDVAIYMLALYNWIFARLAIYLAIYFIIFTVWVVNYAVKPKDRSLYVTLTVIIYLFYSRMDSFTISMYESDYFFPGRKLFRK
ncbi:MAG: EpsG family protein [Acutalibacteraceae bacterium]|nr:EpsG family protein [Acutalibacteraceae bacterium]